VLRLAGPYVYGSAFFQNWLSETYGVDAPRQVWLAARSMSAADAIKSVAFGGSWEPMTAFASAQPLLRISDFTTDQPSSIVPNTAYLLRATHGSYPVSVDVPAATKQAANGAPFGLGANYVEFTPGDLPLTFDGADGYAWRVAAIAYGRSGTDVTAMALDAGSAGSLVVPGFGKQVSRLIVVATIADRSGVQVPFSYGASVGGSTVATK
jgi:hypothetical protein